MNKKLPVILLSAVLCLSLLVGAIVALCTAANKDDEKPMTDLPSASLSGEESVLEEQALVSVFYYGDLRLGTAAKGDTVDALKQAVLTLLGGEYEMAEELTLREEQSSAAPLTVDALAKKVAGIVKSDYTLGCGLYINGVLSAIAEDKTVLQKAVKLFTEGQATEEGVYMELRGLEYVEGVLCKTEELMSKTEVCALLSLCTDLRLELPEVNYDEVDRFLEGGDLPDITPVLVQVVSERVDEEIAFATLTKEDSSLYQGQKVLLQKGEAGSRTLTYMVTYEDGVEVSRVLVEQVVNSEAVDEVYAVGTLQKGTATGVMAWPTLEGRISSYYGYRYLFGVTKLHGGLDIAIPTGTKLYAADGGTVICASDKGNGYGIYVIIDHGNGLKTYYAHMSKVSVKEGDKVNKGDYLGLSGATGRVTGPHLHFEVRVDGATVDPLLYLPKER